MPLSLHQGHLCWLIYLILLYRHKNRATFCQTLWNVLMWIGKLQHKEYFFFICHHDDVGIISFQLCNPGLHYHSRLSAQNIDHMAVKALHTIVESSNIISPCCMWIEFIERWTIWLFEPHYRHADILKHTDALIITLQLWSKWCIQSHRIETWKRIVKIMFAHVQLFIPCQTFARYLFQIPSQT